MPGDAFATRPWLTDQSGIADMPRGMLGRSEGALLHALARDAYRGHGEIIDAGAFLGSSTYCLAKGLEENDRIAHKSGRIHSYDLFQLWQEQGETAEYMADQLMQHFGVAVGDGESTLHLFTANLGPLARHVRVHAGDIMDARWSGRPIEILFVDIAKSLPIWKHVLGTFYPSLIPGVSILVQQDYHHPLLPWIHVAQEYLAPYFEVVEPHADDSVAFRLVERIPDRVLDHVGRYDFTVSDQLALLDRAAARFGADGDHVRLAKAVLLGWEGRFREAGDILAAVGERLPATADPKLGFSLSLASRVLTREQATRTARAAEFDEDAYLAANPDVAASVRSNGFSSGYHHWLLMGRREGRNLAP